MFEDERCFLRAIADNIDDDVPRLVYADWLQERGDLRGEYIRLSCQIARLGPAEGAALFKRQQELEQEHGLAWFGPIDKVGGSIQRARGFADRLHLTQGRDRLVTQHVERILQAPLAMIRHLEIDGGSPDLEALAALPSLISVQKLYARGPSIDARVAGVLAASPHLVSLQTLWLYAARIGADGVRAILESPHLTAVTRLSLQGEYYTSDWYSGGRWNEEENIGAEGARVIAASAESSRLIELDLSYNFSIADAEAEAMADSPYLDGLQELKLYGCDNISERGRVRLRDRFARVVIA